MRMNEKIVWDIRKHEPKQNKRHTQKNTQATVVAPHIVCCKPKQQSRRHGDMPIQKINEYKNLMDVNII